MTGRAMGPQTRGLEVMPPEFRASEGTDGGTDSERALCGTGVDAGLEHAPQPNWPISEPFWLSPWEASGSPRSVAVIDAARRAWEPALAYTKQALGDTDAAPELFEKTVRQVERSQKKRAIQELGAYIFRSYTREIAAERRRRRRMVPLVESIHGCKHDTEEMERRILAKEVLMRIRVDILPAVFRRMAGWSWEEIAIQLGEPKHALESRYCYEMRRVRDLLSTQTVTGSANQLGPTGPLPPCRASAR